MIMDLINRNEILRKMPNDLQYKASIKRILMQEPSVDAIPVIRCKDCSKFQSCNFAQYQGSNGYCSLGECRDGD